MAEEVQNGAENNGAAAEKTTTAVVFSAFKPQLLVQAPKATDAVQFYKSAFGAEEVSRTLHPKRKAEQELPLVLSAELKLGSAVFSVADLADEAAQLKSEGSGCVFVLETDDVDGAIATAVGAGAVADGDVTEVEGAGRVGKVKDPYGYVWTISSPAKKAVVDVEA
ncbi:hypothetical protein Cgig2_004106 [Carnegiea gigantea]|uniref:VOC domain-containing protein n=1 Tax=Carnegiea gigantea TaxID=171969 RepID=A0A9Q1KQM6_9CARY|nr:hypothetical protein Cgig2_004106 [Carnegiea gigantea]